MTTSSPSISSKPTAGRLDGWVASPSAWREDLERDAPKFAEGLARVGDLVFSDGALAASMKRLFVGAICAVKRLPELTVQHLDAAFAGGLSDAQARGAAISVLISRGIPAHVVFIDALKEIRPGLEVADTAIPALDGVTVDTAVDYFAQYFGAPPDYIDLMARLLPRGLEGYYLMREAALTETGLGRKETELLLCSVNAAEYEPRFIAIHAGGARRAGASDAELAEAALCALPFAGVASWLPAAQGLLARDAGPPEIAQSPAQSSAITGGHQ